MIQIPQTPDRERSPVLTVEWDDGPTSVFLTQDWQHSATAREVLHQAQEQVSGFLLAGRKASWRSQLSLENIAIDQLREFNELIEEARREQRAEPAGEDQELTTRHLASTWRGGLLVRLGGDLDWMPTASRQAVVDELLEVLTPPPAGSDHPTTARDRLVRFMEGR